MALNTLPAGAFADDAISSDKINLANTFAFTGTVSGAGYDLLHTITASGDDNVTFNSTYITSNYKKYIVSVIDVVPSTDAQHLKFLASTNQLNAFKHFGFWHPMDTLKDRITLQNMCEENNAPWKIWE